MRAHITSARARYRAYDKNARVGLRIAPTRHKEKGEVERERRQAIQDTNKIKDEDLAKTLERRTSVHRI
jgi:hypothetical protein